MSKATNGKTEPGRPPNYSGKADVVLAKKIAPVDIVSRGASEGIFLAKIRGVETFTTDKGDTAAFRGQCRLIIPGDPNPVRVEAGVAYLPGAAESFLLGLCEDAFPNRDELPDKRWEKRTVWGPGEGDAPTLEVAFRVVMRADDTAITGYVWEVRPLLIDDTAPDPFAEMMARIGEGARIKLLGS